MLKKTIKVVATIAIGGFFLWLAFRNVEIEKVWHHIKNISYSWIVPFAGVVLLSNIIRAKRWRLLIEHEKKDISGVTLVSGVLTGYILNMVTPRLGEVSRPVYVAKRENLSSSKMFGTIVLERVIDLATLIVLFGGVFVYLIADYSLLKQIFGEETIQFFTEGIGLNTSLNLIIWGAIAIATGFITVKVLQFLARQFDKVNDLVALLKDFFIKFKDGLLSIRQVKRWWLFITHTILLWTCYTFMTYIPFYMFDMISVHHLGILDALAVTVISAIGISIPSPGGIGTYHYFVTQALLVLFTVPASRCSRRPAMTTGSLWTCSDSAWASAPSSRRRSPPISARSGSRSRRTRRLRSAPLHPGVRRRVLHAMELVASPGGTAGGLGPALNALRERLRTVDPDRPYDLYVFAKTGTPSVNKYVSGAQQRLVRRLYGRGSLRWLGAEGRFVLEAESRETIRRTMGPGMLRWLREEVLAPMESDPRAFRATEGEPLPSHPLYFTADGRLRASDLRDLRVHRQGGVLLLGFLAVPADRGRAVAASIGSWISACPLNPDLRRQILEVPARSLVDPTEAVALTAVIYLDDLAVGQGSGFAVTLAGRMLDGIGAYLEERVRRKLSIR